MHESGIVHYSEKSAASFVNKIFNTPTKWWYSDIVQESRKSYCERFANYNKNFVKMWSNQILEEYYTN